MTNRLKYLPFIFVFLAFGFGCIYSIYNSDPHHWGFILSTALDYIQGKKLFTGTYIQYGVGQALFFKTLSGLIPINYTSIGVITSLVYASTLLVLFYSLKCVSNRFIATLITGSIFMMHSYSIYPWPDYYAGFFLALASFTLLKKDTAKSDLNVIAAGIFLFTAFLFRNTYVMSFVATAFVYSAVCVFRPKFAEKRIFLALAVFLFLTGGYFSYLYAQGTLAIWFSETIHTGVQYGVGIHTVFERFREAFFPSIIINSLISIFFHLSLFVLFTSLILKKERQGILIFFALLGMSGLVQGLLLYEMFRIQSSCSPLYIVGAAVIFEFFPEPMQFWNSKKLRYFLIWYFISFSFMFPKATAYFSFLDGRYSYEWSQIPIYKGHRFRAEVSDYYQSLVKVLCDGKSQITNLTFDSSIPYLCSGQTNASALPFAAGMMLDKLGKNNVFEPNTFVVSELPPDIDKALQLIPLAEVKRPGDLRFMPGAVVHIYRVESNAEPKK